MWSAPPPVRRPRPPPHSSRSRAPHSRASRVFLANVAPTIATGTVQFRDGTTALGTPVPVFGGFALLITPLPKGEHSLIAEFIPTNPTAFAPSTTSPVPLTVQSIFTGLGF
ncbi:MAG: Ig-like domain-containing protein [Pseudonocardiaceae bacterium]